MMISRLISSWHLSSSSIEQAVLASIPTTFDNKIRKNQMSLFLYQNEGEPHFMYTKMKKKKNNFFTEVLSSIPSL